MVSPYKLKALSGELYVWNVINHFADGQFTSFMEQLDLLSLLILCIMYCHLNKYTYNEAFPIEVSRDYIFPHDKIILTYNFL